MFYQTKTTLTSYAMDAGYPLTLHSLSIYCFALQSSTLCGEWVAQEQYDFTLSLPTHL